MQPGGNGRRPRARSRLRRPAAYKCAPARHILIWPRSSRSSPPHDLVLGGRPRGASPSKKEQESTEQQGPQEGERKARSHGSRRPARPDRTARRNARGRPPKCSPLSKAGGKISSRGRDGLEDDGSFRPIHLSEGRTAAARIAGARATKLSSLPTARAKRSASDARHRPTLEAEAKGARAESASGRSSRAREVVDDRDREEVQVKRCPSTASSMRPCPCQVGNTMTLAARRGGGGQKR